MNSLNIIIDAMHFVKQFVSGVPGNAGDACFSNQSRDM